ncbi:hypothetical protein F66182_6140 [Fusarium sp. NRRL 66182]|nr:hypothetical protein F66182_6140 [Fusarium sp. NRRL 66182]
MKLFEAQALAPRELTQVPRSPPGSSWPGPHTLRRQAWNASLTTAPQVVEAPTFNVDRPRRDPYSPSIPRFVFSPADLGRAETQLQLCSLTAALTLSDFASQTAERHNVPEIEAQTSPEVLLQPLTIARNENERVLIEPSINSVRISIKIKQADEIEHILVHKFTRFLTQRAESFFILRRKPIKGYDISFLITNFHTEEMLKHKLVDFIIQFMEEVDKEISEMKLFLNARARFVAESFLTPPTPPHLYLSPPPQPAINFSTSNILTSDSKAHTCLLSHSPRFCFFIFAIFFSPALVRLVQSCYLDLRYLREHLSTVSLIVLLHSPLLPFFSSHQHLQAVELQALGLHLNFTPSCDCQAVLTTSHKRSTEPRTSKCSCKANMSYHSGPLEDQSGTSLPYMTQPSQVNLTTQHPGPLVSNPPFRSFAFQPQPARDVDAEHCEEHHPEPSSQMNSGSNSWVPSAHQALTNALQASGYANMGAGVATQYTEPAYNPVAPLIVPPNSPAQGMGGQAHGAGSLMTNGTVNNVADNSMNVAMDDLANDVSARLASGGVAHHPANGVNPSTPTHNSAQHTSPVVVSGISANANTRGLGSSGIANRLPHGAQLYPSQQSQGNGSHSDGQGGLISPPHGHASIAQPGSHHPIHSGSVTGQQFYSSAGLPQSRSTSGLPQSVSYNSGLSLMSPAQTPHHSGGDRISDSFPSPSTDRIQHQTEPRNYAPRTCGQPVNSLPPPRFNLDLQLAPNQGTTPQDPFGSPERAEPTNLIPFPSLPSPAVQQAMLAAPMAVHFIGNKSNKLAELTCTFSGFPSLETAMSPEYFPFISGPGSTKPSNAGVVRLKNIPFSTKRAEVVAFIGRNSRMLSDGDEPIHIIMDRATSKTMDAFVEFVTMEDAMRCAEKHHQFAQAGRVSRLGERPIEVELSSQAALMAELFPLAGGVFWDGATPQILPHNASEPWANFKGFISPEEMVMLVKHVEVPHRSPFSKECPQRPYECLISTLRKFPWFAADHVTIAQRGAMYKATVKLLCLLARSVSQGDDPVNLNAQLFQRVVRTAMDCRGFTVLQKDNIAFIVQQNPMEQQRRHAQPTRPNSWVHQYATTRKPGIPLDVVDWYVRIIREQSTRDVLIRPIHERTAIQESLKDTDDYWGYFYKEVGYTQGPHFDSMSLGHCAYLEFSAIERILARALSPN